MKLHKMSKNFFEPKPKMIIVEKEARGESRTSHPNEASHFHVVGDCVKQQIVDLDKIPTEKQCAEIFTKALKPHAWPNALELLGIEFHRG